MDSYKTELYRLEAMLLVLRIRYDTLEGIVEMLRSQGKTVETMSDEEINILQHHARGFRQQEADCQAQLLKIKLIPVLN